MTPKELVEDYIKGLESATVLQSKSSNKNTIDSTLTEHQCHDTLIESMDELLEIQSQIQLIQSLRAKLKTSKSTVLSPEVASHDLYNNNEMNVTNDDNSSNLSSDVFFNKLSQVIQLLR